MLKNSQVLLRTVFKRNGCKHFSNVIAKELSDKRKMEAWKVHSYGENVQLGAVRIPVITNTNDVLIKVEAASVNPIDNYMKNGYGHTLFQIARRNEMELPLTLGRDFCGTIVRRGLDADNDFQVGDKVYGFIPIHKQGSFAEYVIAEDQHICHQPTFLNPVENTSLVYAAMTAWSALFVTGNLQVGSTPEDVRVLILGASGGVGSTAVQLLKSQNVHVTGTCSTDALPLVMSFGADAVFDYTQLDYIGKIANEDKFDIILDCAKCGPEGIPDQWKYKTYVGLNSPLLMNTDEYGLVGGLLASGASLVKSNVTVMSNGKSVRWGFFLPSHDGLQFTNNIIKKKKLLPVIHKEFSFNDLPSAMKEVENGHLRGKVVINFCK